MTIAINDYCYQLLINSVTSDFYAHAKHPEIHYCKRKLLTDYLLNAKISMISDVLVPTIQTLNMSVKMNGKWLLPRVKDKI